MTKIHQLCSVSIFHITKTSKVVEAAKNMASNNIGPLTVIENEKLVGVISERDIVFKVAAEGLELVNLKVEDIKSSEVTTVNQSEELVIAWKMMKNHNFRHLVVVDDKGEPSSILSMRDIINRIALEKQVEGLLEEFAFPIEEAS